LTNVALEMGIDRFSVFNILEEKEMVIALLDADKSVINSFKERIEEQKPEKAVVESISYEDHRNEVPPIERTMQAFQMEQCGKAISIMVKWLDKQDQMLGKQDETVDEIKGVRQDLKSYMNERFSREIAHRRKC